MSREPLGLEAATSLHATALAKGDEEAVTQAEVKMLGLMMQAQFGNVEVCPCHTFSNFYCAFGAI